MANSLAKGMPKHQMYVRQPFTELWENRRGFLRQLQRGRTLENAWNMFRSLPGYGEFVAYEMALDMEMIGLLPNPPDKHTWGNIGPGARRGMNYIRGRPLKLNQPVAKWLLGLQELHALAPDFIQDHIDMTRFDMRVIENGLCETSKYANVLLTGRYRRKYPEGRG
jgi:hypothetical protein